MGVNKSRQSMFAPSYGTIPNALSSTSGTTLKPYGMDSLSSTSTVGPVTWTLALPLPGGRMHKTIASKAIGATSGMHHITTPSSDTTFDGTNDLIILSTAATAYVELQSESSSRWFVVGQSGVTLSTST